MNKSVEEVSWGDAMSLTYCNLQYMEGELLTLIEMLGLPEKQEHAFKSKLRSTYWNRIENNAYHITPEEHNVIRQRDILSLKAGTKG